MLRTHGFSAALACCALATSSLYCGGSSSNPATDAGQSKDGSHFVAPDGTTPGKDSGTTPDTGHIGHSDAPSGTPDTGGGRDTGTGSDTGPGVPDTGGGGHDSGPPPDAGPAKFPAGTVCNATGTKLTPPATLKHLIVVLFENEDFGSVNGNAKAPYISSLATSCGYASNYLDNMFKENLPSLPHYLALTSGSNCNSGVDESGSGCISVDEDATSATLSTTSIFDQVSSWKAYEEDMPSACDRSSSGNYATRHNPPAYYSHLSSCSANDIAITGLTCSNASPPMTKCGATPSNALTADLANDTLPEFAFVTPNLQNDMHDGTVTQGDNWLYTYMPLVLASPAYLRGEVAVLLLWDEQSTFTFGGTTPNLFVSPYISAGTVATETFNHFAVLRAMEKALGISTYLGCASGSITGGGTCAAGSTVDVRSALNF